VPALLDRLMPYPIPRSLARPVFLPEVDNMRALNARVNRVCMIQKEPSFGTEEDEVYGEALDALKRVGIRYMLGGTVALNAYTGIWRETKDLDIFVLENEVTRVLDTLEAAGFETEITDPCWLAKAWKGSPFADIVYANQNGALAVEESWYANAKKTTILDRQILVIPAEEMLLSKMFVAARDQFDMADILHLIFARQGDLDWGRILDKAGEHWELLLVYLHLYRYVYPSHTHYLPRRVFDLLLERCEKAAASQESLRFRGTMLDDVSFMVDVKEWGLPDELAANREERQCPGERQA
jgi:Aminoglycoside-2''-adenylyltransferase